jgi:MerR family transcriptional regulator, light-induced transcriptional regulator
MNAGTGDQTPGLRIGELSRRVGISTDVLRAWERRYGVLAPRRTRAGQRLYTAADEARVRRMQSHMAAGFAPQVAAQMTLGARESTAPSPAVAPFAHPPGDSLHRNLMEFDEAGAQEEIDRLLATYSLDAVLRDVVLPILRRVGEEWERGEVTVAQEHFASNLLGGRLRALARGLDRGAGPRAIVACVPGELHDIGSLSFALALRARGWRVTWLGADLPIPALVDTVRRLRPELVVLGAARQESLAHADSDGLVEAVGPHRLAIGGPGANERAARLLGARLLPDDAIAAAEELALGA